MDDAISAAGEKKGRPAWAPSPAERDAIRVMAVDGASDETIAAAFDISLPTLRRHCADELAAGRAEANPNLFEAAARPQPPEPENKPARGRPAHKPNQFDRERVQDWTAAGIPLTTIAQRLAITVPTLSRRYADDIENARALARSRLIDRLRSQASHGSTAAVKTLLGLIDEADLSAIAARRAAAPVERKAEKETVGKKLQRQRQAIEEATTGKWSRTERLQRQLPN